MDDTSALMRAAVLWTALTLTLVAPPATALSCLDVMLVACMAEVGPVTAGVGVAPGVFHGTSCWATTTPRLGCEAFVAEVGVHTEPPALAPVCPAWVETAEVGGELAETLDWRAGVAVSAMSAVHPACYDLGVWTDAGAVPGEVLSCVEGEMWWCGMVVCTLDYPSSYCGNDFVSFGWFPR